MAGVCSRLGHMATVGRGDDLVQTANVSDPVTMVYPVENMPLKMPEYPIYYVVDSEKAWMWYADGSDHRPQRIANVGAAPHVWLCQIAEQETTFAKLPHGKRGTLSSQNDLGRSIHSGVAKRFLGHSSGGT